MAGTLGLEIDKVVETHCCFCGQQCGIKLKVHDNEVVGFEPWYDFPFNEGKLCPKGVKRYLQGSHPDRLLHPMERDGGPGGFRIGQLGRTRSTAVVAEIRRIQDDLRRRRVRHVVRRVAHEREELPDRQVRSPRVGHGEPRLQRPLLHGVCGRRETRRRSASTVRQPVERHPLADVVWVAGSNIAETFPITTSYIWRARDSGAKLIVQDLRVVPLARTVDLFLPVRPGQ